MIFLNKRSGNLGNVGNLWTLVYYKIYIKYNNKNNKLFINHRKVTGSSLPRLPRLPKKQQVYHRISIIPIFNQNEVIKWKSL